MNKKNTIVFALVLLIVIVALFLTSTSHKDTNDKTGKLKVVASFYPLAYLSQEIGGEKVHITNITPEGVEPHDYEPTVTDLKTIEESDLLVLNGGHLEAWSHDVEENLSDSMTIIEVGDGLMTETFIEEGQEETDPHIWLNPALTIKMAEKIKNAFIAKDPVNKEFYTKNGENLRARLTTLDKNFRDGLVSCGKESIITSHAAFGYLAKEYGFTQVPILGLSPEEEPSAKTLTDIAEFARKNKVAYIFFESLVSPKLSQTIATEIGAKTLVLNPIEGLSSEEMNGGKNYFTVMEENLKNLKIALECK